MDFKFLNDAGELIHIGRFGSMEMAEVFASHWNASESLIGTPRERAIIRQIVNTWDGMVHVVEVAR